MCMAATGCAGRFCWAARARVNRSTSMPPHLHTSHVGATYTTSPHVSRTCAVGKHLLSLQVCHPEQHHAEHPTCIRQPGGLLCLPIMCPALAKHGTPAQHNSAGSTHSGSSRPHPPGASLAGHWKFRCQPRPGMSRPRPLRTESPSRALPGFALPCPPRLVPASPCLPYAD